MERSHRTDDEEFYIPYLTSIKDEKDLLKDVSGGNISITWGVPTRDLIVLFLMRSYGVNP